MGFGTELGMIAAQAAIQSGANYGIQGAQTGKAYKKQRKLNEQQEQISMRLTDYNMAKQLEMWEKTGFVGQKEQLKRAGMNPALLYGGGPGAGGSTNVATGSGNAGSAPQAYTDFRMDPSMIAQLELLQAQKENIEADTANKRSSAKNLDAGTDKTGTENRLLTLEENMKTYMYEADENGTHQGGDLKNTVEGKRRIGEMKMQMEQAVTQEVETRLKEKGIKVQQAQIDKMSADIVQRWAEIANETKAIEQQGRQIDINDAQQKLNKMLAEWNTDWSNIVGKEAIDAVSSVIQVIGLGRILKGKERTVVQGFGGKRAY